jgi:hypothetical protein
MRQAMLKPRPAGFRALLARVLSFVPLASATPHFPQPPVLHARAARPQRPDPMLPPGHYDYGCSRFDSARALGGTQ